MFFSTGRRAYRSFAVVIFSWSLISTALSMLDSSDSSIFSLDDDDDENISNLLTAEADPTTNAPTDSEIGEEFSSSSELSPGPLWLSLSGTDPSLNPASLGSDLDLDFSSILGTANPANLDLGSNSDEWLNTDSSALNEPAFPNLNLNFKSSDFVPLEQQQQELSNVKTNLKYGEYKPRVVPEDFQVCPLGYQERLCCTGPGVMNTSNLRVYDAVVNCAEIGMLFFSFFRFFSFFFDRIIIMDHAPSRTEKKRKERKELSQWSSYDKIIQQILDYVQY